MIRATPPSLRRTLCSATPWLIAVVFGAFAHVSYWLAGDPSVHVVTVPVFPPVVHVTAPPAVDCERPAAVEAVVPTTRCRDWSTLVSDDAVRCPADDDCVIDRSYVRGMIAAKSCFTPSARIVPSMRRDGTVMGVKLYGIREGALLHVMGLENGDLVTAVDGRPIRGLDDMMAAYTSFGSISSFTLEIVRADERLHKRYRLE
jgi:hypothetical protein